MHLFKYLPLVSFDIFLIEVICISLYLYGCPSVWFYRRPSYYIAEHSPMRWWSPEPVNPRHSVQFCWIPCLMLAVVLACSQSASYAWLNHPSRVVILDTACANVVFLYL